MRTGYIAYTEAQGKLPCSLAFRDTEAQAKADALEMCSDLGVDPGELIIRHVDLHENRSDFDPKDWLLFGSRYTDGLHDVAVPHGTKPLTRKCYKFSAYNSQAIYGWGSEVEADIYADHLNRNREINVFGFAEVTDVALLAELESGYHDQVDLDDELAAISGIR